MGDIMPMELTYTPRDTKKQIVLMNLHRPQVLHGDNYNREILAELEPYSVDLLLTSTPYPNARGFDVSGAEYVSQWLPQRVNRWSRYMKPAGVMAFNIQFPYRLNDGRFDASLFEIPLLMDRLGWHLISPYIWNKPNTPPAGNHDRHDDLSWEFVLVFTRDMQGFTCNRQRRPYAEKTIAKAATGNMRKPDVSGMLGGNGANLHPEGALQGNVLTISSSGDQNRPRAEGGSFPRELADRFILTFSNPDDLVFDPCCGAGTVLVQAMLNGRRSLGVDINPQEVEKAEQWIEDTLRGIAGYTAAEAEQLSGELQLGLGL